MLILRLKQRNPRYFMCLRVCFVYVFKFLLLWRFTFIYFYRKEALRTSNLGIFSFVTFLGRGGTMARVTDFYLFTATSERSKVRSDVDFRDGSKPATSRLTIMRPTD